jgi:hypothetical protein
MLKTKVRKRPPLPWHINIVLIAFGLLAAYVAWRVFGNT